ncbi:MAG: hypothetical protein P9F19_01515 [Candidatus Contendobacter sp.]|nr:hypothetical protein [Candidatus Contendobacter sp.]MDG4556068.1 hypothetical protein [Candidatus Contendobacter sp.]
MRAYNDVFDKLDAVRAELFDAQRQIIAVQNKYIAMLEAKPKGKHRSARP